MNVSCSNFKSTGFLDQLANDHISALFSVNSEHFSADSEHFSALIFSAEFLYRQLVGWQNAFTFNQENGRAARILKREDRDRRKDYFPIVSSQLRLYYRFRAYSNRLIKLILPTWAKRQPLTTKLPSCMLPKIHFYAQDF